MRVLLALPLILSVASFAGSTMTNPDENAVATTTPDEPSSIPVTRAAATVLQSGSSDVEVVLSFDAGAGPSYCEAPGSIVRHPDGVPVSSGSIGWGYLFCIGSWETVAARATTPSGHVVDMPYDELSGSVRLELPLGAETGTYRLRMDVMDEVFEARFHVEELGDPRIYIETPSVPMDTSGSVAAGQDADFVLVGFRTSLSVPVVVLDLDRPVGDSVIEQILVEVDGEGWGRLAIPTSAVEAGRCFGIVADPARAVTYDGNFEDEDGTPVAGYWNPFRTTFCVE